MTRWVSKTAQLRLTGERPWERAVVFRTFALAPDCRWSILTMDGERAVVADVSRALYAAAERLPSDSPWIGAFCEIAQLMEGGPPAPTVSARERLRRRGIQARAAASLNGARRPDTHRAGEAHASGTRLATVHTLRPR